MSDQSKERDKFVSIAEEREKILEREGRRVATQNLEGEANNSRLRSFFSSILASFGGVFGQIYEEEEEDQRQEPDLIMASKTTLPLQPRGEAKQKNFEAEGRNRRALKDIGNQVTRNVVRKQVVGLVQPDKNLKKPQNGVLEAKPAPVVEKKKGCTKENPILIEDEGETPVPMSISAKKSSLSKKKTLTSVLTSRSQVACGLTNIDESDLDDELAVVEYVEDIYKFYKQTEDEGRVDEYMDSQRDINAKMRGILVDWLIEVHRKFELMPETLFLTINILDRFLSLKAVPRRELQLVGVSSMLIACKYEEIWAPEVSDFIAISDKAYPREQILGMEKTILGKLEWYLTVPTPYVFLVRYVKASIPAEKETEDMAFFLTELGLLHYSMVTSCCPSLIAASAVYAARCTLRKTPIWTETLKHHTGYSENELRNCAELLVSYHAGVGAESNKLKAVYKKYQTPDKSCVALFAPATSRIAEAAVSN